jgi:hypothetical protein
MKQKVRQAKEEWEAYMMKSNDNKNDALPFWKDGKEYKNQASVLKTKSVAKGVKSCEIKKFTHKNYTDALFGTTKEEKSQSVTANFIRHENHQLYSQTITKTGICGFDDKRFVLDDNIKTYAHGHFMISEIMEKLAKEKRKHQKEEQKNQEAEKLKALEQKVEDEIKEVEAPEDKCNKCGREDVLINDESLDAFSVLKVNDDNLMCDNCI